MSIGTLGTVGEKWRSLWRHVSSSFFDRGDETWRDTRRVELRDELEGAVQRMRRAEASARLDQRLALAEDALRHLVKVVVESRRLCAPTSGSAAPGTTVESALTLVDTIEDRVALVSAFREEPSMTSTETHYCQLVALFVKLERRLDLLTSRDRRMRTVFTLLGVLGLLSLATLQLTSPSNLARGAIVSTSSLCPLTPPQPLGLPRLARVVDGHHSESTFASCTQPRFRAAG